jgi:hypothetical protein
VIDAEAGVVSTEQARIVAMICLFLIVTCVSLVLVAQSTSDNFHIAFDTQNVLPAALSVMLVGALGCAVFCSASFSFGYTASFYLMSVIVGYLWLSYFTPLDYDHVAARISATASFVIFLLPATMITRSPVRLPTLTCQQMDLLARILVGMVAATTLFAASLGFSFGSPTNELLRSKLDQPIWLHYAISICASAVVPFTFAWFHQRKQWTWQTLSLITAVSLYPVTLNKTTFLTPLWLLALSTLLRLVKARTAVIMSLLIPVSLGVMTYVFVAVDPNPIFGLINLRLLAIPSSAIDHYDHYFSTHPLTYFCQITVVGKLFQCSLPDQLGVTMQKAYNLGTYNASLFATEGIASVGVWFAPVTALVCGLVVAFGNLASAGLRPSLVLLSSTILTTQIMNAPLSVLMVTHGGFLMFCLWIICPRPVNSCRSQTGY